MKKLFFLSFVLLNVTLSVAGGNSHPRIFINNEQMSVIKQKVASQDKVVCLLHNEIMSLADSLLASPVVLKHEYDASGRRILSWSRQTLSRLSSFAYAYRYTGDRKYLSKALCDLSTVLLFEDWNASSHFLDAGEMTLAVAIAYDWLYDEIPEELRALARVKVRDYAFVPALRTKGYMYRNNNWNQVCNGGLVTAALSMFDVRKDTLAAELLTKAVKSNKRAMKIMYSPDGNYPEGPSYWNYGTMYQAIMLTAMEDVLCHDFGISQTPGFLRTADYILLEYGASDLYFNYSDFALVEANSCALWYFAWKRNAPYLIYNEARLLEKGDYAKGECKRFVPLLISYASRIDTKNIQAPDSTFFSGRGVTPVALGHTDWTFSSTDKYFGIKGGSPKGPHGHMDGGTFVYDAYGYRWSMDFARQNYAPLEVQMDRLGGNLWANDQNSCRWEIFRYNNYGHSTITVNGKKFYVDGKATLVSSWNRDGDMGATMDLTTLYGGEVAKAVRTVRLVDGDYLEITDEILAPEDREALIRWQMVTPAAAKATKRGVVLRQGRVTVLLRTQSDGANVSYGTWTTNPRQMDYVLSDFEEPVEGTVRCGFESTLAKGQRAVFVTTIKKK